MIYLRHHIIYNSGSPQVCDISFNSMGVATTLFRVRKGTRRNVIVTNMSRVITSFVDIFKTAHVYIPL
jgi:hypothetical protein